MAIHSTVPPPSQQPGTAAAAAASSAGVDIEAWTVSALQSLSVSTTAIDTGLKLSIPLDASFSPSDELPKPAAALRQKLLHRDSQKRREALLKGKEGSRRRQRWENDHLLHVPNVQPPLPHDWEVHPTHPVHTVPYYLAPLWDAGVRHRAEELAAAKTAKRRVSRGGPGGKLAGKEADDRRGEKKGKVPPELRLKMKKAKGAKSLLQDLEEEVRQFLREWEGQRERLVGRKGEELELGLDSEDEEIVFVGRNGTMSDEQRKTVEEELEREKLVFDSLADDHGASFGRWLVHSIAAYYGLTSRSVTVGDPARREAYVGIKEMKTGRRLSAIQSELPRPLWGLI